MLKRFLSLIIIGLIGFAPLPASAIKYKGDLEANETVAMKTFIAKLNIGVLPFTGDATHRAWNRSRR